MIDFAQPWYLLLLGLIPFLVWWYGKNGRRKEGTLRISSDRLFEGYFIKRGELRAGLLRVTQLLMIGLIVIGLARPRIVDTLEKTTVEVVDIILVLDISSSMLAEDFKPNRLETVKKTAKTFIKNRKGDRIGLTVFAGESFIQCPLTVDTNVLLSLLDEVQVAEREYDGTAIGMAIANAINRLRDSKAKSKVMILLSDGSNNAGELDPLTAADLAKEFGIKIYTIGAGTNRSVTRLADGRFIRNEIDEATLKAIAERTNGQYFRAVDERSLARIYDEIDQLERTEIEVKEFNRYRELYGWLLLPALLLGFGYETLAVFVMRKKT